MLSLNPSEIESREFYSFTNSAVVPRPIAFASTVDANGCVNLSPFSFFNVMGINPPILVFSPNKRGRDGSQKNTTENLWDVPEVVINLVDYAIVQQMSLASCEYEKGINEFEKAGLTPLASHKVKPPRVKESPVQFECKVLEIKEYGSANLMICEIVMAHFSESILNEKGKIDQLKTDFVARLGGDWYAHIRPEVMFEVPKPNVHKGIGVDQIPNFIKQSGIFSGNDLGKLGNVSSLPSNEEISVFMHTNPEKPSFEKAQQYLAQNQIQKAWLTLLSIGR
jgi:flavin reductase (DIM6/NTAB) family NADH-FMN oxidoreductase RutF